MLLLRVLCVLRLLGLLLCTTFSTTLGPPSADDVQLSLPLLVELREARRPAKTELLKHGSVAEFALDLQNDTYITYMLQDCMTVTT